MSSRILPPRPPRPPQPSALSFSSTIPLPTLSSRPFPCTPRRPRPPRAAAAPPRRAQVNPFAFAKSKIPLALLISTTLGPDALRPAGPASYKLCCPFHPDSTPSMHVYVTANTFHCFGCLAHGTVIDFEQRLSALDSPLDALRALVRRFPRELNGIFVPDNGRGFAVSNEAVEEERGHQVGVPTRPKSRWRVMRERKEIARGVLAIAYEFYAAALWGTEGRPARQYMLQSRGLSDTTLLAFGCGYAPHSRHWCRAVQAVCAAGYAQGDAVVAGVAREGKGGAVYDVFRDRVVTPIRDIDGNVLALAGRVLGDGAGGARVPKYVNGPETAIFKKSNVLFGVDLASKAESVKAPIADGDVHGWDLEADGGGGQQGYVLVVEGYMDVMSIYERTRHGVACVATMGTAMSPDQLTAAHALLEDPVDGMVIINYDGDDAGIAAVERLCDSVIPMSRCAHAVYIAFPPPEVKDSDEFLSQHGSGEEYVEYIKEVAMPWYDWRGRRIVIQELERVKSPTSRVGQSRTDGEGKGEEKEEPMQASLAVADSELSVETDLAEIMGQVGDELLVAFGGPADLVERNYADRVNMSVPDHVIESLAKILECAQRSIAGLNAGALVHSWADSLSRGDLVRIAPLYRAITRKAEELSGEWKELAPASQVQWMAPPPWIVEELPRRKQSWIKQATGSTVGGGLMNMDTFLADPKRLQSSIKRMQMQRTHLLPHIHGRRTPASKMLSISPRRVAEEIVLRCLIFSSERERVEALTGLLEVMVRCAERELPFWTSRGRELLFEHLTDAEGPLLAEDVAAELEDEEWWTEDLEDLVRGAEAESDLEWREIKLLERKKPVEAALCAAGAIEAMSGKIASRLALRETGHIMERLFGAEAEEKEEEDEASADEVERLLARQAALAPAVDKSQYLLPEEQAAKEAAEEAARAKVALDAERVVILQQLKSGSVPFPGIEEAGDVEEEDDVE